MGPAPDDEKKKTPESYSDKSGARPRAIPLSSIALKPGGASTGVMTGEMQVTRKSAAAVGGNAIGADP